MSHISAVKYSRPFLTESQIENLTIQSGLDSKLGQDLRMRGFKMIWRVCSELSLPIRTFDAAMTLFLNTLLYSSPKIPLQPLVGASILLGFKVQDTPKKTRELAQKLLAIDGKKTSSKDVEDIRVKIVAQEKQILETCAFDFRVDYPHYYVVKICKELKLSREAARTAWDITTDAFYTWCPLRQPAHTLAFAAIILAAKVHSLKVFPLDSAKYLSQRKDVNECLADMLHFYLSYLEETNLGSSGYSDKALLETMHKGVSAELGREKRDGSLEGLLLYDQKIGEKGTAEYLLFKP